MKATEGDAAGPTQTARLLEPGKQNQLSFLTCKILECISLLEEPQKFTTTWTPKMTETILIVLEATS